MSFVCQTISDRNIFLGREKSRLPLHKSPIAAPERLSRLLMACFAYIWVVYLGALCLEDGWHTVIDRTNRCDLSLFQLGLRFLDHILNEELWIPVAFHVLS